MASVRGRTRMIDSINKLTGNNNCTEAVITQERPKWAIWAIIGAGFVAGVLGAVLDAGPGIASGAFIGLAVGLAFVATTTFWVVARVGSEVILARSSKWTAKALEIVERYPAPLAANIDKGLLQTKVWLPSRMIYISTTFRKRVEAILS